MRTIEGGGIVAPFPGELAHRPLPGHRSLIGDALLARDAPVLDIFSGPTVRTR